MTSESSITRRLPRKDPWLGCSVYIGVPCENATVVVETPGISLVRTVYPVPTDGDPKL
jgi:hypothetical protein